MKKSKILLIFVLALFLEVIVFNITSFRALFGKYEVKSYEDLKLLSYEGNDAVILIDDVNTKVATLKIELKDVEPDECIEYKILYSDETSEEFRGLRSKNYIDSNEKTKYMPLYLSGETNTLLVSINKYIYDEGKVSRIILNEKIPFEFNIIRFIIVLSILGFVYLMKNSEVLNSAYSPRNIKQEFILLGILALFLILLSYLNTYSSYERDDQNSSSVSTTTTTFYNKEFVEALVDGKLYLLEGPSEKFLELDNPYDTLKRSSLQREIDYIWDTAFYNGHQYVYFGILPVLIAFLPYYVITDKFLKISFVVFILSIFIFILMKEILQKLLNRYFKEIPFKNVIYYLVIFYSGTLVLYANGMSRVYEVVIISALYFVLQGIYFILKALENDKNKYLNIYLGCLCLALSVACRPTALLVSILILPYLINLLIKNIKSFKENKKDLLKLIASTGIPYVTIGVLLMIYNYMRFGNVFDFGARYQLTMNNMLALGSRMYTIPMGIICNLFSIPNFIAEFPFITHHNELITFNGYYYIENMIGGLFIIAPICFANFLIFKVNKKIENKELKIIINMLLVVGILIAVISIVMAGSMQRYLIDYAWMLVLSGILIFEVIYNIFKSDEAKRILQFILCVITIFTFLVGIISGIISEKNTIKEHSPEKYYKLKYTICFWE